VDAIAGRDVQAMYFASRSTHGYWSLCHNVDDGDDSRQTIGGSCDLTGVSMHVPAIARGSHCPALRIVPDLKEKNRVLLVLGKGTENDRENSSKPLSLLPNSSFVLESRATSSSRWPRISLACRPVNRGLLVVSGLGQSLGDPTGSASPPD